MKQFIAIIDKHQFSSLLEQLDKTDWTGIAAQLIIAAIAAYSGFYFQKKFKKDEAIQAKRQEVYRFNEAVTYMGALLEAINVHLEQLVLKSFIAEEIEYAKLAAEVDRVRKGFAAPAEIFRHSFMSISSIEIAQTEQFTAKIPNMGKYAEVILAFHRLRYGLIQFATIAEERNFLIKQLVGTDEKRLDIEIIYLRYGEIFDRTSKLLMSGEAILDAAMYVARNFDPLSKEIKNEFKKISKEKLRVNSLMRNEFYEQLAKTIKGILDLNPELKGRFLHPTEDLPPSVN